MAGVPTRMYFNIVTNNTEHHTNEISMQRLILRRGQSFKLRFDTKRQIQPDTDTVLLTAETGPSPSEAKGTRAVFGFPWHLGGRGKWKVELQESRSSSFTMVVTSPADACVGLYKLSIRTGSERATPFPLPNMVLLFNPWCAEDWVYLPREDERNEYVMAEDGEIYRGAKHYISSMNWDFGQFEEDVVDICIKLLDMNPKCLRDAAEDVSARCNPIYVGRVVSAMINANGDNGVLAGRWHAPYYDGKAPTSWDDSVEILRQWYKNGCHPVKYGQCWVFAAVMCTVLRCLGIPCRVVSNFESAHDTDKSLTIDLYWSDYGVQPKKSHDSVWNFHVWVEGWMKRPDLSRDSTYDGWQVLDPTPQEKSAGVFCCGPCPVKAILEGHTDLKYDTPFVFAEVNADQVTWMLKRDGSKQRVHTETRKIGQNISTKAVGKNTRQDITASYKYPEGLQRERHVFEEAVRRSNLTCGVLPAPQRTQMPQNPSELILQFTSPEGSLPINGKDLELYLSLRSDYWSPRDLSVHLMAQATSYTGVPDEHDSLVWSDDQNIRLQPRQEHKILIRIPYYQYWAKMVDNSSLKVSAIVWDKQIPEDLYLVDEDVILYDPEITLEADRFCEEYQEMVATVTLENPLSETLKDCSISLTGTGLVYGITEVKVKDIPPGGNVSVPISFMPYRSGFRRLMADFDCSFFRDIKASCFVDVKRFGMVPRCGVSDGQFSQTVRVRQCYSSAPPPRMMAMTSSDDDAIVLG